MAAVAMSLPVLRLHVIFVFLSVLLSERGVLAMVAVRDLNSNETAATFSDMPASFGDDFPAHGLWGRVKFAKPNLACADIEPAPRQTDEFCWIVLISRGVCKFAEKVRKAEKANFCGAIIYNDEGQQDLTHMGGDSGPAINIPSTFVGYNSGMNLGALYSYLNPEYVIHIREPEQVDYRMYLWPFAIVVGVCFFMIMVFLLIKFMREHNRTRVARLSKKHLKKIPIRKFKKGQYYDTCAICLDEYEDGEKIRVLPCDHAYHTKCIDPWLTRNKKTCPVCKRRVIPGKDPNLSDSFSDSEESAGGGTSSSSATTPLLLNSSQRTHGSLNQVEGDSGPVPRAQSAPAMFEATVIVETEEGAVGGMSLLANTPTASSSGEISEVRRKDPSSISKKKKKKKERREEQTDGSSTPVGEEMMGDDDDARKAEKRERKKRKKEKKRREEREKQARAARSSGDDAGGEWDGRDRGGSRTRLVVEADVEVAADGGAYGNIGDHNDEDGDVVVYRGNASPQLQPVAAYINPNFFADDNPDGEVPTNDKAKKKKQELSEVV